jgi:eukaryotic-like serine/threonine-protein kinase
VTRLVTAPGGLPYARFSPDGRWVAYQSAETGAPEVYLRPFPGPGAPVPVSLAGGGRPAWRADGREQFYQTPRGDLMAAAVSPGPRPDVGPPRRLLPAVTYEPYSEVTPYDPAPDGQRVLVSSELRVPTPPLTLLAPWALTVPDAPH